MIGDILLDTGNKRCWLFTGRGGTGKTTIAKLIQEVTCNRPFSLEPNKFLRTIHKNGEISRDITLEDRASIASVRLVLANDIEIDPYSNEINMQTIKLINLIE